MMSDSFRTVARNYPHVMATAQQPERTRAIVGRQRQGIGDADQRDQRDQHGEGQQAGVVVEHLVDLLGLLGYVLGLVEQRGRRVRLQDRLDGVAPDRRRDPGGELHVTPARRAAGGS
jgi:hypothetical protein